MTRLTLTSTTALMIGLSVSSASAQEAVFPCNLPDGAAMADAQALAVAIGEEAVTADLVVTDDPAVCGPAQLAAAQALIEDATAEGEPVAVEDQGEEAAPDPAEVATEADAPATQDEAVPADTAPVDEAPVAAEPEAPASAPEAEAQDTEEPATEAAPVVEPTPEDMPVAEPAPEAMPPAEDEAPAATEPQVNEETPTEEAAPTAEDATTPDETVAPETTPAEAEIPEEAEAPVAPEAEATAADDSTDAAAGDAPDAAVAPDAQQEDTAVEDVPATGPADAETLAEPTAEELAARDARRAERAAARQQSAAATAESDSAEVVTEEVQSEDVRSADEDFDTQVLSDTATAEDDDDGLSRFEQALLLGLGAATVGAILNNGDAVVSNSGDRVIVEREGELRVLRDDNTLLRQPGAQIATQTFDDGSTLTTVTREDGSFVTTIRAADGTVLRRTLTRVDGTQVQLINDLEQVDPIDVTSLPQVQTGQETQLGNADDAALRAALSAGLLTQTGRSYSLEQIRDVQQVRELSPQIELDTITFASGSAAIQPSEAEELGALGRAMLAVIEDDPSAVFLIEGHTDAVGDAAYNLGLSDRRAETVALALTQYFGVPPENLVTQGYGESYLKVRTLEAERANRRAAVRNITPLLRDS
ncbi:OmpA family protein [Loktanella sp. DSM 29012]|uniref:OmpA family protein n=1 Tax=Loktanella sp. DSM 29012 TaxID=1881056 RepID=UPI0008BB73F8|nr:OmpA family protein [Loktanella sp. DSM 29012]SEQ68166.1 OmpA family protein [Loktanella sp. DSM 29012]